MMNNPNDHDDSNFRNDPTFQNNPLLHHDPNFHNNPNFYGSHNNFQTVYVMPPQRLEDKQLKYICPHCGKEIRLTFHTTKCPRCGGKLDDIKQYYYDYESQQANTFWGRHNLAIKVIFLSVVFVAFLIYIFFINGTSAY